MADIWTQSEDYKIFVDKLGDSGFVFSSLKAIELLGSRTKVGLYEAIDLQRHYWLVAVMSRKSRFLRKDVAKIQDLKSACIKQVDHQFAKTLIWIDAPLCSKANALLQDEGWVVIV